MAETPTTEIRVRTRPLLPVLALAAIGLLAAFATLSSLKLVLHRDHVAGLVPGFDVLFRATVPTSFAVSLFLLCAGLAALHARAGRSPGAWRVQAYRALPRESRRAITAAIVLALLARIPVRWVVWSSVREKGWEHWDIYVWVGLLWTL